jgi:hypothetical protein
MKKTLLLFLLSALAAKSQTVYSLQKFSAIYVPIAGGTTVSGNSPWTPFQSFTVPVGFAFNYFGSTYSVVGCEGSGFCNFDPSYFFTLHPYTVEMEDAGTGTPNSKSPVSYTVDGSAPNRVCKIQWKNCRLKNDTSSRANFQMWLYETLGIVEMRTGSCSINNSNNAFMNNGFPGPLIGLYNTSGPTHFGYVVQGASPTESLTTLNSGTIANIFQNSMSASPPTGMVYRFSPGTLSLNKEERVNGPAVFPNPATTFISLASFSENHKYSVFDLYGRIIITGTLSGDGKIDVRAITPGIYFLETENKRHKFIKQE